MGSLINEVVKLVFLTVLVIYPTWASASDQTWAKTTESGESRTTTLQFYFHDIVSGKNPTSVQVAQPANLTQFKNSFGFLNMIDDPLTIGPDPGSKMVGHAQGLSGSASQGDIISLFMAFSCSFVDGPYNGTSITVLGRSLIVKGAVREMPVVGGTGLFRMARGYALAHTYFIDMKTGDAIVGYNVTLLH